MANKVLLKKSSVAAKVPVAADLDYGEIALNYQDGKIYYKKADNSIDAFSAGVAGVSSVAGNTGAITATQLITAINTVDGTGSGLDADLLDGNDSTYFTNATNLASGTIPAARMPAHTGDITSTAGSVATTLATVNSNVGAFGSSSAIPVITVNAKGLVTAISTTAVTIPSGSISVTGGDLTLSGTTGTAITNATLATVNSNVGSFGSATLVPIITVNAKGLVTAVSTATITSLPTQTSNSGKYLSTDGTTASWNYVAATVVSPIAPTSPINGMKWLDTTTTTEYTYVNDGDSSQWVELGPISSGYLTLGGVETLTNKSLSDSTTFFIDDVDATKKMQFQVSGVTTGTTRTLTVPNYDGTIATLTGTETFTNKTLTSPTLTAPVLGTPASGNFSTGTFTWPTFNQNTTGTAANVTGTVAILNGGSGATTAQGAMNAFAAAVTSGSYLRGNGTNVVMSTIQAADVPTLNQNTTGTAANVTGTVAVANGGTGVTTSTGTGSNVLSASPTFTGTISAASLTLSGDLIVNGTTTTINSTTLTVDDINIELGSVTTPTDVTAAGGGITLKGATDKTISWGATNGWTSSEDLNVASGKIYRINGTSVLSATTLGSGVTGSSLTSVGTIGTGTWQGTAIADTYLATISTANKVSNSATTATSANTASAIVARDASGNFTAGTVTAVNASPTFYRIKNPGGGEYSTGTSSLTGAIAVTLPVGMTNTMVRMTIKVYEYTTNRSFEIHCGGYNYSPGTTWANNPFAYIIGNPSIDRNFTVRFGYNSVSGKAIVYIGELASTWSYPQVFVTDVQLGYGGQALSWATGWSIGFEATAFQSVTATITNSQVGYAVSTNTANSTVLRDGSGNFSAGTITAALTGTASGNLALTGGNLTGAISWNTSLPNAKKIIGIYAAGNVWTGIGMASTTASPVIAGDPTVTTLLDVGYYSNDGAVTWTSSVQFNKTGITVGGSAVLTASNYTTYAPTLTGTGASGSWGIAITGNAATATTASNANLLNSISAVNLFNNMGQPHTSFTSFDAQGVALTRDFGYRFVQGSTNGPGTNSATNYYAWNIGLGSDYAYNTYAAQFALPRGVSTPYLSVRYQEAGVLGAWQKIAAGYADSAGASMSATTAINIAQGSAGQVLYQNAAGSTAFTNTGTAGQVLKSNGTAAPTWGTAASADNSLLWYFMG